MSSTSAKASRLVERRWPGGKPLQVTAKTLATCVYILAILATAYPRLAAAHGGGVIRLSAVPAGPYILTAWVSPQAVKADRPLHVSVSVEREGKPILDAEVLVRVVPNGDTAPIVTAVATTEQSANKLLYEADLTIVAPGTYLIEIWVNGLAGTGMASFIVDVQSATNINWLLIVLPILVSVAAFGLFRRRQQRVAAQIRHS